MKTETARFLLDSGATLIRETVAVIPHYSERYSTHEVTVS